MVESSNHYSFSDFYSMASHVKLNTKGDSAPHTVSIRPASSTGDEEPSCRVYFIGFPKTDSLSRFTPSLFCCDINMSSPRDDQLVWFQLIFEDFTFQKSISLAESLLRERMRASATGVADFSVTPAGQMIITTSGSLLYALDKTPINVQIEPLDPIEAPVSTPLQPQICPTNADLVACVANEQLTVGHAPSNTWVPLTHVLTDSGITVGMPSFVVQEEFDRYIGYWWNPRPASTADGVETLQILYEVVDERPVGTVHLLAGQVVETHRYPKAGTANAICDLRICQFSVSQTGQITDVCHLSLPQTLLQYIPGFEYLVRAGWTPDGRYVWCQLLTRLQQRLEFILIPASNFNVQQLPAATEHPATLPCVRLLVEEDTRLWVNVHNRLAFLSSNEQSVQSESSPDQLTLLWASHRSGFSHLYLMQRSWTPQDQAVCTPPVGLNTAIIVDAVDVYTTQLTSGSWELTGSELWVDETRQLVYFEANREHPMLQHVYAVSYAVSSRGRLTRLTPFESPSQAGDAHRSPQPHPPDSSQPPTFSHLDPTFPALGHDDYPMSYKLSAFHPKSGWAVLYSSSLTRTPGVQVVRFDWSLPSGPESTAYGLPVLTHVTWLQQHRSVQQVIPHELNSFQPPKVFRMDINQVLPHTPDDPNYELCSSGPVNRHSPVYFYGILFLPSEPKPKNGYPLIHYIYGGPGVQIAHGSFSRSTLMHAVLYCHFGYAMFLCDCRGSEKRGMQFAGYIKNRLGEVELQDHIAFVQDVARDTRLIDLSRVAITGHSYGGYMSLMAAMRFHYFYKAFVAGSPVVNWAFYDTAYTERYMGLPQTTPSGYWGGNILNLTSLLPSDKVRLMIAHGAQDENVHFYHTSNLVQQLETNGKPFKLLYYPDSRHGIKQYEHLEANMLSLLETVLEPVRVPSTAKLQENLLPSSIDHDGM